MASYRDTVNDDYDRPIPGVLVYVFDKSGALATLDNGQKNPITTDILGAFAFSVVDGVYALEYRFAGTTRRLDNVIIGEPAEFKGAPGDTGPADNTYTSYAAMQASDPTRRSARLVGDTDIPPHPDGPYNNPTQTIGGWVPQAAAGVNFDGRSTDAKLREEVSVKDGRFGAKGDATVTYASDGSVATITGTDDTAAINAALAGGGRVKVPRGTYRITGRLLMQVANTEFVLEAGVIIAGSPWRYNGSQFPFGSAILITAANCSVTGAGIGLSTIALTGGSEANGITFLHCDGGYAGYLTLDGGMAAVTAVEDDTFMTGINVLNATGGNPSGVATRVTIEKIEARHWTQYGLQAYGDLASVDFFACHVHHNGILDQSHSRGAGIAITRGNRNVTVRSSTLEDNKQDAIFQTSAGLDSYDLSITDNIIRRNGRWGGTFTEEANFASVAGQGTRRITIKNNVVDGNGTGSFDSRGGFRAGTYDGVGYQSDLSSSGNVITRNTGYGWLVQTNDGASNKVTRLNIDDVLAANTLGDIAIGAKLDTTVRWNAAKVPGGSVINLGDSALVSQARGNGPSVASAGTITLPEDGDGFVITGSSTITNIMPAPGREVTFVSAGNPVFAKTGNIVLASPITLNGNDTITLRCIGQSWFRTGGSVNA